MRNTTRNLGLQTSTQVFSFRVQYLLFPNDRSSKRRSLTNSHLHSNSNPMHEKTTYFPAALSARHFAQHLASNKGHVSHSQGNALLLIAR